MSTQTESVTVRLRELLMKGEFKAGEKLGEKQIAARLDVSRTPVRLALSELAQEGLLEYKSNKGFVVRRFSAEHIISAVAVREQLEGMAAGLAASRGLSEEHKRTLEACLLQVDGLLLKPELEHRDVRIWSEINGTFHETIVLASGNEVLADLVSRLEVIPLAAAKTFAGTYDSLDRQHRVITQAQVQHRWVYEAMVAGDPARAETLMKQHIHEGRENLRRLLADMRGEDGDERFPILRLVS